MRNKMVSTKVQDLLNMIFDGLLVKQIKSRHISLGLFVSSRSTSTINLQLVSTDICQDQKVMHREDDLAHLIVIFRNLFERQLRCCQYPSTKAELVVSGYENSSRAFTTPLLQDEEPTLGRCHLSTLQYPQNQPHI